MKAIRNGNNFESVYASYLTWFQDKARPTEEPKSPDELLRCQVLDDDVFENAGCLLNRAYYSVFLAPSQSRSGQMELFSFTLLNLMVKGSGEDGDVVEIIPAEYMLM